MKTLNRNLLARRWTVAALLFAGSASRLLAQTTYVPVYGLIDGTITLFAGTPSADFEDFFHFSAASASAQSIVPTGQGILARSPIWNPSAMLVDTYWDTCAGSVLLTYQPSSGPQPLPGFAHG